MRILLVRPAAQTKFMSALYRVINVEPLALEYVAAGVCGDHDVRILDMTLQESHEVLLQTLQSFKPDVVGATAISCEVSAAKEVFAQVKAFNRNTLTVMGGIHATVAPEDCLESNLDVVVIGEGVSTFREIVEQHERGGDLREVKGIALHEAGGMYRTPARPLCHPDELPMPARSLTEAFRDKYRFSLWAKDIALVISTQGCPNRCDFCICWKLTDGKYLKRDVEKVVEELKTVKESHVYFIDDEALMDAKRSLQLAKRIKEEGIEKKYTLFVRADTICRNPDVVSAWAEIGWSEGFVGFEASSDEELGEMRKRTRVSMNDRALEILTANGITCIAALMVRPDYGKEEFQRLLNYVKRLQLESPHFIVQMPFPGTDLYEKVKDQIVVHDYDLYDFSHALTPTTLPLEEFYSEFGNLFMYHREPAPLQYQMRKLAAFPPQEMNETIANLMALQEAIETLTAEHRGAEQVV